MLTRMEHFVLMEINILMFAQTFIVVIGQLTFPIEECFARRLKLDFFHRVTPSKVRSRLHHYTQIRIPCDPPARQTLTAPSLQQSSVQTNVWTLQSNTHAFYNVPFTKVKFANERGYL